MGVTKQTGLRDINSQPAWGSCQGQIRKGMSRKQESQRQNNSGVSLAEAGRYWFSQGLNSIALAGDDLTA